MPTAAAADRLLRRRHSLDSSPSPASSHRWSLRRLSLNPERSAATSNSSSSFLASYIPRCLYFTNVPSQILRSPYRRSHGLGSDRKEGELPLSAGERGGNEVEDLGFTTTGRRSGCVDTNNGCDQLDRVPDRKELTDENCRGGAESEVGLEEGELLTGEVDGLSGGEKLTVEKSNNDEHEGDLGRGEAVGYLVDGTCDGGGVHDGFEESYVRSETRFGGFCDGEELQRRKSRGDVEHSGELQRGKVVDYRVVGLTDQAELSSGGCSHGDGDGLDRGEMVGDEIDGLWKELGGGGRNCDAENGGGDGCRLERAQWGCDQIGDLCDQELVSGTDADDEENGSEYQSGFERGEIVKGEMVGLGVAEKLVSERWDGEGNGLVENGGELERGESVGVRVEDLCSMEGLGGGGCNGGGKDGSQEFYGRKERNELIHVRIDGWCDGEGLHDGKTMDDVDNKAGLERGEMVVNQVVGSSNWDELSRCDDDQQNGAGDGGRLEEKELVGDGIDGSHDSKAMVGGWNISDMESEGADVCRLEREPLVSDQINDLCVPALISGKSANDEGNDGKNSGGLERGTLVHNQVGNDLLSGKFSDNKENGGDSCECNGLEILTNVPNHAKFCGASEEESSSQSSSLTNLNSELDSVRSKLLQEVDRRKEAENSLIRMQKQWQRIASYFALDGLAFSPISVGQSLQFRENSLMKISQDILVARIVCEAFERGFSQAEREASMGLLIESKSNSREIAQLHDKLKYYKSSNREMIQNTQELEGASCKQIQKRKRMQKLIWTCIGFSVTVGASLIASSFLPPDSSGVTSSFLSSDQS